MDPWILVYCRTCGIRHSDPYMGRSLGLYKESTEEAKEAIARQVEAARTNNASYARVRDGRDDYGHHKLELALEIPRHKVPYGSGIHLHLGDRWSETPLDGTLHLFRWSVFFSVGGVGNRLAHWLTKGKKRDIYLGGKYRAGLDLTDSIQARSDQINADDLVTGPQTYTVREVISGKAESPFDFLLMETDRAYRPSKTMRRVIVAAWGPEAANYAGRVLTLYREPSIKFGGQTVGGIRVSHMSHIDQRVEVMLQVTRGKREKFAVEPLAKVDMLRAEWKTATPERKAEIEAEVKSLGGGS
jgi:hypothetical protein